MAAKQTRYFKNTDGSLSLLTETIGKDGAIVDRRSIGILKDKAVEIKRKEYMKLSTEAQELKRLQTLQEIDKRKNAKHSLTSKLKHLGLNDDEIKLVIGS